MVTWKDQESVKEKKSNRQEAGNMLGNLQLHFIFVRELIFQPVGNVLSKLDLTGLVDDILNYIDTYRGASIIPR